MKKQCFSCGNINQAALENLFGYEVCADCKPSLGFHKDATILKNAIAHDKKREQVPENSTYVQEVNHRLNSMEERYIRARLKLLHIQHRLQIMNR
ncbi:MAG: hypothetical protein NPIRA05_01500 [Nitrospirales bacterium]|nr:MAG: hypothetical protein NPIRA05_01500 [Nitrospirales bacterium]